MSKMSQTVYSRPAPVTLTGRRWPDATIKQAPIWCAVDLRDGNQALPSPMTPEQKRKYFQLLCDLGFPQIEVGFPAAAADEYKFTRDLIEGNLVPPGVTISVLVQARPELIERTLESLQGVKRGIIHFYIATSELHQQFVFGKTPAQQVDMAVAATRQIRDGAKALAGSQIGLEFSPEEFTDTKLDFALEICNRVVEAWEPKVGERVILNLPATVERRLPNEYADLIEEFLGRQRQPDRTLVSLHAHNDMGMAVAATMLGLKAGAGRVEGTLFGHGERTGNVDLVTCALNLEYLGVKTGLNFDQLPEVAETVEEVTGIETHPRHPYAGEFVFTAFSGSHQDAIRKGLGRKDELARHFGGWKIPYLHVSPDAIGRSYERFIRINSQSGKGGIAHVMEQDHNVKLPRWVQTDFAHRVQAFADEVRRELTSKELWTIFKFHYKKHGTPIELLGYWPRPTDENPDLVEGEVRLNFHGKKEIQKAVGNGPISAFVHAIKDIPGIPEFVLDDYEEGTRGRSAEAEAICFVKLRLAATGDAHIGVGLGSNIDQAAARAIVAALNALIKE